MAPWLAEHQGRRLFLAIQNSKFKHKYKCKILSDALISIITHLPFISHCLLQIHLCSENVIKIQKLKTRKSLDESETRT